MKYLLLLPLFLLWSCTPEQASSIEIPDELIQTHKAGTLKDRDVQRFIKAYTALRKSGQSQFSNIKPDEFQNIDAGKEGYAIIEKTIKDNGFDSYAEFVVITGKIGWAFNIMQGTQGVDKFDKMKDDGLKQIDEALANPQLPTETRKELEATREKIVTDYAKNRKWASWTLDKFSKLTNEADMAIVKKYEKELLTAFTGIQM